MELVIRKFSVIQIRQASLEDLHQLVPLFDLYRIFYKQSSDLVKAERFLKDRFINKDSTIFLAFANGSQKAQKAVGFTQLFNTFSSVSMEPFYILNDLYVLEEFRGQGIAEQLIDAAKKLANKNHQKGIALETDWNNPAQKLYERLSFEKDIDHYHYFWSTKPSSFLQNN